MTWTGEREREKEKRGGGYIKNYDMDWRERERRKKGGGGI